MSEEEDIARFSVIGDALKEVRIPSEMDEMINGRLHDLATRTSIYLEFMAAAFIEETGIKASEAELVIAYGLDKVVFSFRRKGHGS